ncbi:MAG: hypothetical protein ABI629_16335 [bacterium]
MTSPSLAVAAAPATQPLSSAVAARATLRDRLEEISGVLDDGLVYLDEADKAINGTVVEVPGQGSKTLLKGQRGEVDELLDRLETAAHRVRTQAQHIHDAV